MTDVTLKAGGTAEAIPKPAPHAMSHQSVAASLETEIEVGLTSAEAQARLNRHGPNALREKPGPTFFEMILSQFKDFLIILLIIAAIVSGIVGEVLDASVIVAIVIVNAIIGVYQERRADQSLQALRKMAAGKARVIRDGSVVEISSPELVPGDVVLLEAGNYVPADIRLVEAMNLQINEAALTGESVPTGKNAEIVLDEQTTVGDMKNSAFMGTIVTRGRGKGIVVATGMETQIGEIAGMLESFETQETPLQKKLTELGKLIGYGVIGVAIIVVATGLLQQRELLETFLVAVSLAVAAIPEGLPAVVTVVLAIGLQRMVRRHALIRRLPAVETLGACTAIASDKTGTLTKGEMTVVRLYADGHNFTVTGEGYEPQGQFEQNGITFRPQEDPVLSELLRGSALNNDSILEKSGETEAKETWRIVGDPTEGSLLVAAAKAGLWRRDLDTEYPRQGEAPFTSERKLMTTIHPDGTGPMAFVKGAPDIVLSRCTNILTHDGVRPLTESRRQEIATINDSFAADALRVLGVASRHLTGPIPEEDVEELEQDLTFIGLVGMIDPPRPEAREAIGLARGAGIRSVMITGDHKTTAMAIARSLGLLRPNGKALSGEELDQMNDDELAQVANDVDVYARVSPQHKVRVVQALQSRNHIVGMTGDGVNDAPALKRADIGIAMGITGTDVSKEASAMILTDDNFASIVAAIEEGRVIYANIRKFVAYLLSANVGEIIVVFAGILAGLPLVFQPIHLLWVNLVTDSLPAMSLGVEKPEPGVMKDPPRSPQEGIVSGKLLYWMILAGALVAGSVLAAFLLGLNMFHVDIANTDLHPTGLAGAQTMAFATISIGELLLAFSARSLKRPVFSVGVLTNKMMVLSVTGCFALLLIVMYVPFLQPAFNTVALGLNEWAVVAPLSLVPFIGSELAKSLGLSK